MFQSAAYSSMPSMPMYGQAIPQQQYAPQMMMPSYSMGGSSVASQGFGSGFPSGFPFGGAGSFDPFASMPSMGGYGAAPAMSYAPQYPVYPQAQSYAPPAQYPAYPQQYAPQAQYPAYPQQYAPQAQYPAYPQQYAPQTQYPAYPQQYAPQAQYPAYPQQYAPPAAASMPMFGQGAYPPATSSSLQSSVSSLINRYLGGAAPQAYAPTYAPPAYAGGQVDPYLAQLLGGAAGVPASQYAPQQTGGLDQMLDQLLGGVAPATTAPVAAAQASTGGIDQLLAQLLGGAAPAANNGTANLYQLLNGDANDPQQQHIMASIAAMQGLTNDVNAIQDPLEKLFAQLSLSGADRKTLAQLGGAISPLAGTTAATGGIDQLLAQLLGGGTTAAANGGIDQLLAQLLGGGKATAADTDINALLSLLGGKTATATAATTPSTASATATTIPGTTTTTKLSDTIETPTKTVTVDTTPAGKQTKVWGDPHFEYYVGNKLLKYDVQGVAGKKYTLIKDGAFNLNATFGKWGNGGATAMTELGFKMKDTQIGFDLNDSATIDGKKMESGKEYKFDTGIPGKEANTTIEGKAVWNKAKKQIEVTAGEYHFVAKDSGSYIDLLSNATSAGVFANGKAADGLLGHTFNPNFVNYGKGGKTGARAQGEGFLDKDVSAYEATDLFNTAAKVKDSDVEKTWGTLSNVKTAKTK